MIENIVIVLVPETLESKQDSISVNSLLLKEAKGVTKKDRLIFYSLKNIYLLSRVLCRLILGRKRRDQIYIEREISFRSFLDKAIKFLGIDNLLLKINMPKYGYQAYCRTEDNFNDFVVMTQHEHDLIERFSPKEGDVVVDIGAHIGLYTIIASKRVGPNGKVIAIEAHPGNFQMLNHNIKLNGLNNVIPFNYIAYSKEMDLVLAEYARMLGGDVKDGHRTATIHVNTLDNLLQQNRINEVNWMNIDVEGAELEVLRGAHNILSKSKDISVLIEIHGISHLYEPTMEILNLYNFKIEFEKTFEGYRRQNMRGAKNVLLRKSSY
jgi:FkbM family methyltransferase